MLYLPFKALTYFLDVVIPFTIASFLSKTPLYKCKVLNSFLRNIGVFYLKNGKRKVVGDPEKSKLLHDNK